MKSLSAPLNNLVCCSACRMHHARRRTNKQANQPQQERTSSMHKILRAVAALFQARTLLTKWSHGPLGS
eukprot:918364-Amphidinium_carterae.1